MFLLLLTLLGGMLAGYFIKWPEGFSPWLEKIQLVLLFIIIFLMGCKIGIDNKVLSNLGRIGFGAFVLALGTIAGSIGVTYLTLRFFSPHHRKEDRYDS